MIQTLLFLGFSGIALLGLIITDYFKKVSFQSSLGLFLIGIFTSVPFIMVEYIGGHMKYYFVLLAFIIIELALIFLEHRVKAFHELLHHNVKDLRILSFILMGMGFTYSEISFSIFHSHASLMELLNILPIKTLYALSMHTVLASASTLINLGSFLSETIYETVAKLLGYYSRIVMISVSHFLYTFSLEHNFFFMMGGLLLISLCFFFYVKKKLDQLPKEMV